MHRYGSERRGKMPGVERPLQLQIENDRRIVTIRYSVDGKQWSKYDVQMEVSGYHRNVAGAAVFRDMRYQALEASAKP